MLVIAAVKRCHSSFPLSPTKLMIPGEVNSSECGNPAVASSDQLYFWLAILQHSYFVAVIALKKHKCSPTCSCRGTQWHYLRNVCRGKRHSPLHRWLKLNCCWISAGLIRGVSHCGSTQAHAVHGGGGKVVLAMGMHQGQLGHIAKRHQEE